MSIESKTLSYLAGFGNTHSTEALPGALPIGQNSPQKCPLGLYAEQLSGSSFTAPRDSNRRSWLYRIHPSVMHSKFTPLANDFAPKFCGDFTGLKVDPNQMRWFPLPLTSEEQSIDFVTSLVTMAGSGSAGGINHSGLSILMYSCNKSMTNRAMSNSDGEMLIVPQIGTLDIQTEFGKLLIKPNEICVIPRGVRFSINVDTPSRGYILEVFGGHFKLPELGPIGSNGLANARDFLYPIAAFEDIELPDGGFEIVNKFGGSLFSCTLNHSPFDVVAWHGNLAPFKYDLSRFNVINTVSYDHPDPSIFTVLTCSSESAPGVALADFVIFPPRWMVAENTFRPPYFHRNIMTEFMGMIWGKYDAKVGFQAGGASLHSCMSPHGPDEPTFTAASAATLAPRKFEEGLAFMFETNQLLKLTNIALQAEHRDVNYQKNWQAMPKLFKM